MKTQRIEDDRIKEGRMLVCFFGMVPITMDAALLCDSQTSWLSYRASFFSRKEKLGTSPNRSVAGMIQPPWRTEVHAGRAFYTGNKR